MPTSFRVDDATWALGFRKDTAKLSESMGSYRKLSTSRIMKTGSKMFALLAIGGGWVSDK
jgi:hypothetical protein